MGFRVEKDGYSAELTDDLEMVYLGPNGQAVKWRDGGIREIPGLRALEAMHAPLIKHRQACAEQAREWAASGYAAPRALAEKDPVWRQVIADAGVPLVDEPEVSGRFARIYAGPFGSTLIQVIPERITPHRDLLMQDEKWEPIGAFRTGIPDDGEDEIPFPEKAIALHPGKEDLVLDKLRALKRETKVWTRLHRWKHYIDKVLTDLDESEPALLVTLLDGLADLALVSENARGERDAVEEATAWFSRARKLERVQGEIPAPGRVAERYGTFADGRALSVTALRAWVRDLAGHAAESPDVLEHFRPVTLRHIEVRGEIYPQLAGDVRRLAKAAGLDEDEELAKLLRPLVAAGRMWLGDHAFWTAALKGRAIDLLGDQADQATQSALDLLRYRAPNPDRTWRERDHLLRPVPEKRQLWSRLLERTGALAQLAGETPGQPDGAAAHWLSAAIRAGQDKAGIWDGVYEAAEKLIPRLLADGEPVRFHFDRQEEKDARQVPLDLIDLLLERGVPVSDPPERLNAGSWHALRIGRRPELRHLIADERFARELGALLRGILDMTIIDSGGNGWYQPHEIKGWRKVPALFETSLGRRVLREWCDDERARLRAGVNLHRLVRLLGRFVHVGEAVDIALKDAGAAAEFKAVDVMPLVMAEMPEEIDRERAVKLMEGTKPEYLVDRVVGRTYSRFREELPELEEPDLLRVAKALVMGVNCQVGLNRLTLRFSPVEDPQAVSAIEGVEREEAPPEDFQARLMKLVDSGPPVWGGDLARPSDRFLPVSDAFRAPHAHALTFVLRLLRTSSGYKGQDRSKVGLILKYGTYPFVSGPPGRWRLLSCLMPEDRPDLKLPLLGDAFRTGTSAAVVVYSGGTDPERLLLEYAPDGVFSSDLLPAGTAITSAHMLEPVRPAAWFTRFAELYREHGSRPAGPERTAEFAERVGITVEEAGDLLAGLSPTAPHQLDEMGASWVDSVDEPRMRRQIALANLLPPEAAAALHDKLLPDDPERLWTEGLDIDRASEWWLERFGRLAFPAGLFPLATKEIVSPGGVAAGHRDDADLLYARLRKPGWLPELPLIALTGRVAAGRDCLSPDLPGFPGDPRLLALPRVAAWAAYRTAAGDPLRPAIGAAITRLREALGETSAPQTLFSLHEHRLMGEVPALDAISVLPAVSIIDDGTYELRHVQVDLAALTGPGDPVLDDLDAYLDSLYPSQWLGPSSGLPALADLRLLLSDDFAALGTYLSADGDRPAGWEQHPARSVPHLVTVCAKRHALGEDAAALYLMLLALPDPTDRNVKTWTGWKAARLKAAAAELAETDLVIRASRSRAGRSLFPPGAWQQRKAPRLPLESAKLDLLPMGRDHHSTAHIAVVPSGPVPVLFERAWARHR